MTIALSNALVYNVHSVLYTLTDLKVLDISLPVLSFNQALK